MKLKILNLGIGACFTFLVGCAGVNVQSVGTNTRQAAYELSGKRLPQLEAEAGLLCPSGYEVLRQWHRYRRAQGEEKSIAWWASMAGSLSYDAQEDQAQMTVACKP